METLRQKFGEHILRAAPWQAAGRRIVRHLVAPRRKEPE